jgi:hypothetical protein
MEEEFLFFLKFCESSQKFQDGWTICLPWAKFVVDYKG